jgi:hypothetical protein
MRSISDQFQPPQRRCCCTSSAARHIKMPPPPLYPHQRKEKTLVLGKMMEKMMIKWELYGKCTAIAAYLHVDVGCSSTCGKLVMRRRSTSSFDLRPLCVVGCSFVRDCLRNGSVFFESNFSFTLYVDNPARDCSLRSLSQELGCDASTILARSLCELDEDIHTVHASEHSRGRLMSLNQA